MADDWGPGDLAECIADEWWNGDGFPIPANHPIKGVVYMVTAAYLDDEVDLVLELVGYAPGDTWQAMAFRKVPPRADDILRETKVPVDA